MTDVSPAVIVFGGSRDIGAARADGFAGAGWQVCVTYANQRPTTVHGQSDQADIRDVASHASRRIHVNSEAVGPVNIDLLNADKDDGPKPHRAAFSPFNRIGRPEEVAEVLRYLASERASWIHGEVMQPNGGMV